MSTTTTLTASTLSPSPAERARAATHGLKLVSTLPFHKVRFWVDAVQTLARAKGSAPRWLQLSGLDQWRQIVGLWRAAPRADAVLLNGGERSDMIYLALAGLTPWIRSPHVIVDAHWQPGASRLHRMIQRCVLRSGRRLLADVQIHSPEEVPLYVRNFGLPPAVLKPLPWSTSLTGFSVRRRAQEGVSIVSGGYSYRDYATFLKAVAGQAWPVQIGLPPSSASQQVRLRAQSLANVQVVEDWTFEGYWQAVADSRAFAMPIVPGLQRCTADQTLLNAMALGTIVVATDAISSRLYIQHGVTGFLVPEGDAEAWQRQLAEIYAMPPERAQCIRDAARQEATTTFSEEERLACTLERSACAAREWRQRRQWQRWALMTRLKRWWWMVGGVVAASSALLAET